MQSTIGFKFLFRWSLVVDWLRFSLYWFYWFYWWWWWFSRFISITFLLIFYYFIIEFYWIFFIITSIHVLFLFNADCHSVFPILSSSYWSIDKTLYLNTNFCVFFELHFHWLHFLIWLIIFNSFRFTVCSAQKRRKRKSLQPKKESSS